MLTIKVLVYLLALIGFGGIFFQRALRKEDRRLLGTRPLAFMLVVIAASLLLPNALTLYALLIVLLPALSRTRMEAVTLFIVGFLILPGIPYVVVLGSLYVVRLTAEMALSAGLAIAFFTARRSAAPLGRLRYFDMAFLAFFLPFLWIDLHGHTAGEMLRQAGVDLFTYIVPYLCVSRSIRSETDLRHLLLALCLVALCLSVDAIFEARSHWPILSLIESHLHVGSRDYYMLVQKVRGGLLRASASFFESLSFATFLMMALLATLAIRTAFATTWQRYAVLLCLVAALFVTGARGGAVAALAGVCLFDFYTRRYASLTAKLVTFGSAGFLLLLAAQSSDRLRDRLGLSGNSLDTAVYRQRLLQRGLQEFSGAPWFGRAATRVFVDLSDMRQGEGLVDIVNVWLFFLMAAGIVGTAIILFGTALPTVTLFRRKYRRQQSPRLQAVQGFVVASTLSYAAVMLTTSWSDRPGVVWVIVLAAYAAIMPIGAKMRQPPRAAAPTPDPHPAELAHAA